MKESVSHCNPIWRRYERLCANHEARPILKVIGKYLDVDLKKSFTPGNHRIPVDLRQLTSWELKRHTNLTLCQIALIISGGEEVKFDHATIIHHLHKIDEKISIIGMNGNSRPVCKKTFKIVNDLEELLGNLDKATVSMAQF